MRANQAEFPVSELCRLVGVSTSGYYAWLNRAPSKRSLRDKELGDMIEAFHEASDGTYGAPRIHCDLKEAGQRVGGKRVARLMAERGLQGVSRRRGYKTTVKGRARHGIHDLVDRQFVASSPDELWVADITYVPTWAGYIFLAVVVDVFSRKVVGWSMANHLETSLVLDALNAAVTQRKPKGVVHHSDQGSQYTSLAFGQRCRELDVRP